MAHKVAHQLKHPAVQDHIAVAHLNNLDFVQIQETTMEDLYVFLFGGNIRDYYSFKSFVTLSAGCYQSKIENW